MNIKMYDVLVPDRKFLRNIAGRFGVERWVEIPSEEMLTMLTKHTGPVRMTKEVLSLLPSRIVASEDIGQPHLGKPVEHPELIGKGQFILFRSFGLDRLILSYIEEIP